MNKKINYRYHLSKFCVFHITVKKNNVVYNKYDRYQNWKYYRIYIFNNIMLNSTIILLIINTSMVISINIFCNLYNVKCIKCIKFVVGIKLTKTDVNLIMLFIHLINCLLIQYIPFLN